MLSSAQRQEYDGSRIHAQQNISHNTLANSGNAAILGHVNASLKLHSNSNFPFHASNNAYGGVSTNNNINTNNERLHGIPVMNRENHGPESQPSREGIQMSASRPGAGVGHSN